MPVPIKPIEDKSVTNPFHRGMDYSFLANQLEQTPKKKVIQASNKDAKLLFDIWTKSKKVGNNYNVESINSKDVIRLKSRGFITGGTKEVQFTNIGKTIISTMALSEENKFKVKNKEKSYSEILASMDKRNKPGYRMPKYAASQSNLLRP